MIDDGISDKRVTVFEEELSSIFNASNRDGSTLSEVIRKGWDSPDVLHNVVKANPVKATRPHISVISHTTEDELRRTLSAKERANGTGNRFLWCLVRRSKPLALPQRVDEAMVSRIADQVTAVIEFARSLGTVHFSPEAAQLWESVYPSLTTDYPGMFGALVARAEAQVIRVALIYAVTNRSRRIEPGHILSALALWHFCEVSTRRIFWRSNRGQGRGQDSRRTS